jgi:hypothetical protein
MNSGTARAIGPIADQVLAWVAYERTRHRPAATKDELRRIELMAQAAKEASMFFDLYGMKTPSGHLDFVGGDPHAEAPEAVE